MARPSAVIRSAGMMLPGNAWPVSGSLMAVESWLKLPLRIRLVGRVRVEGEVSRRIRFHSMPPKKKILSFAIGPPRLNPGLS